MPQAIPAIAAAFATATASATAFVSALAFKGTLMAGLAASLFMKPPGLQGSGQNINIQLAGSTAPLPILLGMTGTQGLVTLRKTYADKNEVLAVDTVLSIGPVESIESFSVMDRGITYTGDPHTGTALITGVDGVDMRASKLFRYGGFTFAHRTGEPDDYDKGEHGVQNVGSLECDVLSDDPITEEARRFKGYGTALKPAQEPICVARKPHKKSIAANVLDHGVGAFNIDACRVPGDNPSIQRRETARCTGNHPGSPGDQRGNITNRISFEAYSASKGGETLGRFPANVIHDGSDAVLEAFPHTKTGKGKKNAKGGFSGGWGERGDDLSLNGGDEGSAARYFYCAKPSKAEKGDTSHVTVKPVALMRYLVKLVTPAGGLVLDPFGGSGTTGIAAREEGFRSILMERDPTYAEDIRRRVAHFNDSIAA